ncbi:hypothetical protein ACO0LM_19400 [Undibacterium sp. Di26W]|uniref:hypothetical protein n=1 Tax=Undibacterium sp. Di26W TaxID=3413035 RepID=UPI003BF1C203
MTQNILANPEFQHMLKIVIEEKIPFCHLLGKRVANVLMDLRNEKGERIATGVAAFMLHGRA